MAMEFTSGPTEIDMKVNGGIHSDMAMVKTSLQMAMYISANTRMALLKGRVNTTGLMVTHSQDFSKMERNQGKGFGRKRMEERKPQTFIKVNITMT